jgi:hypothetical protein
MDSEVKFETVATKFSDIFRRFAEELDDPKRIEVIEKLNGWDDFKNLLDDVRGFAWERMGGVQLCGDDWKERSSHPEFALNGGEFARCKIYGEG